MIQSRGTGSFSLPGPHPIHLGIIYNIGDILHIGRISSSGDNFVSDSGDCLFIGRTDFYQGRIQNLHCPRGGGGTSEQRSRRPKASLRGVAPKGGGRGGGHPAPPAGGGTGGLPRKILRNLHQNGAF